MPWDRENEDREHIKRRLQLIRSYGYTNSYIDSLFASEEENKPLEERREFIEKVEAEKAKLVEESKGRREKGRKRKAEKDTQIEELKRKATKTILEQHSEIQSLEEQLKEAKILNIKDIEAFSQWMQIVATLERILKANEGTNNRAYIVVEKATDEPLQVRFSVNVVPPKPNEQEKIEKFNFENQKAELEKQIQNRLEGKHQDEIKQLNHKIKNLEDDLQFARKWLKEYRARELEMLQRSEDPQARQFARDLEEYGER